MSWNFESRFYHSVTGPVPTPHSATLPWALTNGKIIIIDGIAGDDDRFSINLLDSAEYESSNILVHFNPRFDGDEVVLNHKDDGDWGNEDHVSQFPFGRGQKYQVRIEAKEDAYHFKVNWEDFCQFAHRLPMNRAKYLYISSGTLVENITFEDIYNPVHRNPAVPFTEGIPKNLSIGRVINVKGVPKNGAERFSVNLLCGPVFDSDDIAMHMDNRFSFGQQNTVVRTHRAGGDWGHEEDSQDRGFPFTPGTPFMLSIVVTDTGYSLGVETNEKGEVKALFNEEFKHRIPYQGVNHIHITGDCDLTEVSFVTPA